MSDEYGACYWLLRIDQQFVVLGSDDAGASTADFPRGARTDFSGPALPVGIWRGLPCLTLELMAQPAAVGGTLTPIRAVFGLAGAEAFALVCRASQLLDWQKNHRYCGRCATPTERRPGEFAMVCPACALPTFPRISPAVMVLIGRRGERGEELLLARSPHFKPGVFSALAGFVEAGETLEQCAVREVREEVGVEIANLRYFHSQPWPFPDSLMIAFFADYAGGKITPAPDEIEAAGWYPLDALPLLPDPVSIARRLIDAACAERRTGAAGGVTPATAF